MTDNSKFSNVQNSLFDNELCGHFEPAEVKYEYWPADVTIVGSASKLLPCCNKKVSVVPGTRITKKRCSKCKRSFYPSFSVSDYLTDKLQKPAITLTWHDASLTKKISPNQSSDQLTFTY